MTGSRSRPLRSALTHGLGWLLAALLRLLAATWRIDAADSTRLAAERGTPRLVGFWHGKYFALLALLRGNAGTIWIGAGWRGEVIAVICAAMGYRTLLVPRHDRERALDAMRSALRRSVLCATALDGPVGPARRVKRSLLRVAAAVGAEIVPVTVVAAPRVVLRWRWDRREIPLPFARVRLVVGAPIPIPKGASDLELEEWQRWVAGCVNEIERIGPAAGVRAADPRATRVRWMASPRDRGVGCDTIDAMASAPTQPAGRSALVLVDIQRDFCRGGALAVPDGDAVVPAANRWIARARAEGMPIIASRDWHPADHASFREQGGPWPPHCVQGSPGAEFHPDLAVPADALVVSKGSSPDFDSYSDFDGTGLADRLRALAVQRLFIGGLALEYCVRATVLDALAAGFEAHLLLDATRALEVHPGDAEAALAEMTRAGALVEAGAA